MTKSTNHLFIRKTTTSFFSICFLLILTSCASTGPKKGYDETHVFNFQGEQIYDASTGFLASPSKKIGGVIMSSKQHKYTIILHHSNSWEIKTGPNTPLYATDHVNGDIVSIMKPDQPKTTTKKFLQNNLKRLQEDDNLLIREAAFVKAYGHNILKYQASYKGAEDAFKDRNTWAWNYWIAVMQDSQWYVIHWSKTERVLNENNASNVSNIYKILTFFADHVDEMR